MAVAWSILTDDQFVGADAAPGATLPGPSVFNAPSTGGAYLDRVGSIWTIASHVLGPINAGTGTSAYTNDFLNRPSAESVTNVRMDATVNLNNSYLSTPCFVLRNNNGTCYLATIYNTGPGGIGQVIVSRMAGYGTSLVSLNTTAVPLLSLTADYVVSFYAFGTSPTTLSFTVALASAPTAPIATIQLTDNTAGLQTAGVAAVTANGANAVYKKLTTYTGTGTLPPIVGNVSATETATGISITTSSAASGGAGAPFTYGIFRGTDPNFTANSGSLLTTVSTLPYVDTTAVPGTEYYYGVVAHDVSGSGVAALPTSLTAVPSVPVQYVAAMLKRRPIVISWVGDSVTNGAGVANNGTTLSPTVPYFADTKLAALTGRTIVATNNGISGYTTTDWAPGGTAYNNALQRSNASSSMSTMVAANPTAQILVSINLGTNDSASSGTNNGGLGRALTPTEYNSKMTAIVNQILTVDWPSAIVVLQYSKWFSPNTNNSSVYLQPALSLLTQYNAQLDQIAAAYPGKVFVGDKSSFDYFAQNYTSELQSESGAYGNFYLHPSGTAGANGKIGTQSLGEFWAQAILPILGTFNPGTTGYPESVPIGKIANGVIRTTVPWAIPATGVPGSNGTSPQPGSSTFVTSTAGSSANELCNLLDRMVSDGRAQIS